MECRLCLHSASEESSISIHDNPGSLVQHIWLCCRLQIEKDDNFPDRICLSCKNRLELFNSFKSACIHSDRTQKLRLTKSSDVKTEEIILDDLNWEDEFGINIHSSNVNNDCKKSTLERSDLNQENAGNSLINGGKASLCETQEIIHVNSSPFASGSKLGTHFKPQQCEFCSKSFTHRHTYLAHLKSHKKHNGINIHQCDICLKPFTRKYNLTVHIKGHSKPFKCDICLKSFFHECILKRHIKSFHGMYKFQCNICQKKFTRKYNLELHIKRHNESFKCNICLKSFTLQSTLERHMKCHNEMNKHKCNICSQSFSLKSSLKRHTSTFNHSNTDAREKPLKCNMCSMSFNFPIELKEHVKIHENKPKLASPRKSDSVKTDASIQLGSNSANTKSYNYQPRIYKCDICFKIFSVRSEHGSHKKTHWNGLYKCDVCSILFGSPPDLEEHMKTH
ncbi:uncharacterized protein LOC143919329 [Arctopsyche grandis]|uniref:uncharacterized protein LOC143919329 n=1 Tax=Arctopsyche grandis TaxID=121162 RepID=UPI00406D6435